jgi:hypothetical protein
MDRVKCPICYTEVEERNFKEAYVSPYDNQSIDAMSDQTGMFIGGTRKIFYEFL